MSNKYVIRPISETELPGWWQLRLTALRSSPDAFGSDYEAMKDLDPVPFYLERDYLSNGPNMLFAAISPDGEIVAQVGTYAESGKRSHIAHIISVFTHPDHRGQGLASQLVQAGINHLRSCEGITSIRIAVNSTNAAAIHVYEGLGFQTWGEEPDAIRAVDGSCHNERHMVLRPDAQRS